MHCDSYNKALEKYRLCVTFQSREVKCYGTEPLFKKWISFQSLKEIQGLFEQVKVDAGDYGISWNDELDLSCDELYINGKAA